MATLDDKLLGEKLHYYCSSSSEDEDDGPCSSKGASFIPEEELRRGASSNNTGPKGVIEDWRRFKQLERENRADQDRERRDLAKRLAMTCRTEGEDEVDKAREEERKEQGEEEEVDPEEAAFLASYMRKRMQEMVEHRGGGGKRFGRLLELKDDEEFLSAVDDEGAAVVVVVLIHEEGVTGCARLRECLREVATEYPGTKFCRVAASALSGLSRRFGSDGVPALLVYRRGELVSSFLRVADALGGGGDEFFSSDVESFLVEHGVLQDKELVPQIIRAKKESDSDSD